MRAIQSRSDQTARFPLSRGVQDGAMNSHSTAFDQIAQAVRRASRTNLYLAATLIGENWRMAVTVRNLSSTGALVRASAPLDEAGPVSLVRGSLRVLGSLAWRDGRNGGIAFDEPIEVSQWAPGAPGGGQREVERMVTISRGQVAPLTERERPTPAPAAGRACLDARMAEELAFASRRLEALGSQLADDPSVLIRHAVELQDLDITAQVLGHLARMIGAEDPAEMLATIGMDDLRRRLERSPIG